MLYRLPVQSILLGVAAAVLSTFVLPQLQMITQTYGSPWWIAAQAAGLIFGIAAVLAPNWMRARALRRLLSLHVSRNEGDFLPVLTEEDIGFIEHTDGQFRFVRSATLVNTQVEAVEIARGHRGGRALLATMKDGSMQLVQPVRVGWMLHSYTEQSLLSLANKLNETMRAG